MTTNIHCPIIHGGLQINLKSRANAVMFNHCCFRKEMQATPEINLWQDPRMIPLRELNDRNEWDPDCWHCQGNELSGLTSFRSGMLDKFGIRKDLSGPVRLDLMIDTSCNLACRICGPDASTFWQKHYKENNIPFIKDYDPEPKVDEMINILRSLDLGNLEMLNWCGGETLMGKGYWRVLETIADIVPHAKEKLMVSFQTNGTQTVDPQYYGLIEKFHLVRLQISLDGVGERFNYQRWPADWQQVTENILNLRNTLPSNIMFNIEETHSIFNLYYHDELVNWCKNNFSVDRKGDIINHVTHPVVGPFNLDNLTQEYVDAMQSSDLRYLIKPEWRENPDEIREMIAKIQQFDTIRGQDWCKTFTEVAEFYSRYLR